MDSICNSFDVLRGEVSSVRSSLLKTWKTRETEIPVSQNISNTMHYPGCHSNVKGHSKRFPKMYNIWGWRRFNSGAQFACTVLGSHDTSGTYMNFLKCLRPEHAFWLLLNFNPTSGRPQETMTMNLYIIILLIIWDMRHRWMDGHFGAWARAYY